MSNLIPVAAGQEDAFPERFRSRAGLVKGHAGFIRFYILKPTEIDMHGRRMGRSPHHIFLTYWDRGGNVLAWTNCEDFKTAHSDRPPSEMFAGENVFELHEVIKSADPAAAS